MNESLLSLLLFLAVAICGHGIGFFAGWTAAEAKNLRTRGEHGGNGR
jgi:hypothetical protein